LAGSEALDLVTFATDTQNDEASPRTTLESGFFPSHGGSPPKMDAGYFMENPKTSKLDENSNYPNGTTGIVLENWRGVYLAPICLSTNQRG